MIRIGIDVGGTGIQTGVVNEQGAILAEESIVTRIVLPFSEQIRLMTESVRHVTASAGFTEDQILSVGVGVPGIASKETGEIIKCPNMGWNHVPFREEWIRLLNKPLFIDNDANVAALAESVSGVSAGTSSSVFITIGTGIGSGIILNGKIWSGAHGIGAELGHTIMKLGGVPCTCGNHGCLERYCSATALIRMACEKAGSLSADSALLRAVNGDLSAMNARIVIDLARNGDPVASAVFNEWTDNVSQAIANVVNFLDPEVIVIGGGVSRAGAFLLDALNEKYPQYVVFRDQPIPEVRLAVLGPKAGIIGAAMLS